MPPKRSGGFKPRYEGAPMTKPHAFSFPESIDHDVHTRPWVQERVLNESIVRADISSGFEEYLEIFDKFYTEDVEVSSGPEQKPLRGKASVRSLLLNFLIPLHIMAEIGGLAVSIQNKAIPADLADETHSEWTLELLAQSGQTCTLTWRVFRKWSGALVAYEHHYDHQQIGGPLTYNDLSFDVVNSDGSSPKPSTFAS
jgi:hypothetical protein